MRPAWWVVLTLLPLLSAGQTRDPINGFSITLVRGGCLGNCPVYRVTILGSGAVRYEGRWYVRTKDIRKRTIPVSSVQKLIQKLRDEDFYHWEEANMTCLDLPEVDITATLQGQRKHVFEGCNEPGKILELADEIDTVSGAKRWIGKGRDTP
jgi:hypothetical protein